MIKKTRFLVRLNPGITAITSITDIRKLALQQAIWFRIKIRDANSEYR